MESPPLSHQYGDVQPPGCFFDLAEQESNAGLTGLIISFRVHQQIISMGGIRHLPVFFPVLSCGGDEQPAGHTGIAEIIMLEEKDMIGIHLPDGFSHTTVKVIEGSLFKCFCQRQD